MFNSPCVENCPRRGLYRFQKGEKARFVKKKRISQQKIEKIKAKDISKRTALEQAFLESLKDAVPCRCFCPLIKQHDKERVVASDKKAAQCNETATILDLHDKRVRSLSHGHISPAAR